MDRDSMDKLMEKVRKESTFYSNMEQVVFSVCIEDILTCIVDVLGEEKVESLEIEEIEDLIREGIKGAKNIDWSSPIENRIR